MFGKNKSKTPNVPMPASLKKSMGPSADVADKFMANANPKKKKNFMKALAGK